MVTDPTDGAEGAEVDGPTLVAAVIPKKLAATAAAMTPRTLRADR